MTTAELGFNGLPIPATPVGVRPEFWRALHVADTSEFDRVSALESGETRYYIVRTRQADSVQQRHVIYYLAPTTYEEEEEYMRMRSERENFLTHTGEALYQAWLAARPVTIHGGTRMPRPQFDAALADGSVVQTIEGEYAFVADTVHARDARNEPCTAIQRYCTEIDGTWYTDVVTAVDTGVYHPQHLRGNLCRCHRCDDYYEELIGDYCESCEESMAEENEERRDSELINDYHGVDVPRALGYIHNASPTRNPRPDTRYFGVELEVECGDRSRSAPAERVVNALGHQRVVLTEDGSLDHGFEIVTAPMTLKYQRRTWERFTPDAAVGLRSGNTRTCGMHVHVSRNTVSALNLGRLLVFINAENNKSLIDTVAQRGSCSYARKVDKKVSDGLRACDSIGEHDYRYEAINLTNDHTIEFRIFKGSTRKDRILKNIDFVQASLEFTKNAGNKELMAACFLAWIARPENRKMYPYLYAYLAERGMARAYKRYPATSRTDE